MRKILKKIAFPATLAVILVLMSWLMIRNYQAVNDLSAQGKRPVSIVTPGAPGKAGESAYEIAVRNGYKGSETEWLATFKGQPGSNGLSAYQVAAQNGYNGSESDWLTSLIGPRGLSAYQVATANGFVGTQSEWLASLIGLKGDKGDKGDTGATGATGVAGSNGTNGLTPEIACVIRTTNSLATRYVAWKYTTEANTAWRDLYKLPTWAECTNPIDPRN